ncbi:hypothetical protein [Bacillus sp. FJAT-45350]|uniref:hypothetical protein n=1 Tax=Bacillus sp. FJAT-45350 TaxID=2011014 RepID=UPI000BB735AE|nr:hypothetical protein [Bacillus sp. FJAT-45350]
MDLKKTIDELSEKIGLDFEIPKIPSDRKYWLVRTDSGLWFEEFSNENYVAIGWDKVKDDSNFTLDDKEKAIEIIESLYPEKSSAGHIYGTLKRFRLEMKIGDIIMIPSEKSETIHFGVIEGEEYLADISETEIDMGACPYRRRRNVMWLEKVYRKQLDPKLFSMMQSHHTISNATDYGLYIDKTLNSLYIKGNVLHSIFNVKLDKDLSYSELQKFVNIPDETNRILFKDEVNLHFESKIRLQSIGDWLLMASENAALRLFLISLFIKQVLLGGEVKFLGFKMTNEPLFDILKRNNLGVKENNQSELKQHTEEVQQLSKKIKMKAPGLNLETTKKGSDSK